MKRIHYYTFVLLFGVCSTLSAQTVKDISVDELLQRVNSNSDTIYVVNFWATWCHPCVEELPVFSSEQLNDFEQPTKVLLVSLDFKNQKDKTLLPFIEKKAIQQEVVLLDERNPNEWINKVDTGWSGAIPATLIFSEGTTQFHEGELNLEQLLGMIGVAK